MIRFAVPLAVFAVAAMATFCGALAQNNTLDFRSGPWRGGVARGADGQITSCMMYAQAGGGAQFFFRLTREFDFSLGLVNTRWALQAGATERLAYWIDGGAKTEADARAVNATTLHIDVVDRESIFQRFRRGLFLYLTARGQTARLSLKGTSAALERLRLCATAIASLAPPAPAPAPAPEPPPSQPAPPPQASPDKGAAPAPAAPAPGPTPADRDKI